MKLWSTWKQDCVETKSVIGENIYYYVVPGNKSCTVLQYTEHCAGCDEPFLGQLRRINGQWVAAIYCSVECRTAHHTDTEETKQKKSYASRHRSAETIQRVLEANRRPRSAETRAKQTEAIRGFRHTEETKAKIGLANKNRKWSKASVAKSVLHRQHPDREHVAVKSVMRRYVGNAKAHNRVFAIGEEEFRSLIKQSCHYCGTEPKALKILPGRGLIYRREDEVFYFNGIDRINTNLGYILDNVVTACSDCNKAKLNKPLPDFITWVMRLDSFLNTEHGDLIYYGDITEEQQVAARTVYRAYCTRKDSSGKHKIVTNTIPFSDFSRLIRTQCYYCGSGLSNRVAEKSGRKKDHVVLDKVLLYNGLDRIDSSGIYELSNVVPCCRHCNRAKLCMTQEEFYAWVHRVAKHVRTTPDLLKQLAVNVCS